MGSNVRALALLTFTGNENKRQERKIYFLKFEEMKQKSFSYRNLVNERLKIHFEQRSNETLSSFS